MSSITHRIKAAFEAFIDPDPDYTPPEVETNFKQEKAKPNPAYLEAVRELPCAICEAFGEIQDGPTFAHHCIMGRFSGARVPDEMAIGLCHRHHQGQAPGDCSVHHHRKEWTRRYGFDVDYIAVTQDMIMRGE